MITYKQLTLEEIFEDCQNKFDNDKYQFFSLFDEAINLDEIVPVSFVTHFHASTVPEEPANISFIKCLRHFLSSVFSQSRRTHS